MRSPRANYPLLVRLTHWVSAIALLALIGSGLQIFNAHPYLYAADASDPGRVILSLPLSLDGDPTRHAMILFGHVIPTGPYGFDAFPPAITLGGWLAGARRLHFAAAWIFTATGFVYLAYMGLSRRKNAVWPQKRDWSALPRAIRDHLRFPPILEGADGALNPLQKVAYAAVPLVLAPLSVATGLAMSPRWDAAFHIWPMLFGGRQFARSWHFLFVVLFLAFVIVHVILTASGGWPTLRRMVTGRSKRAEP